LWGHLVQHHNPTSSVYYRIATAIYDIDKDAVIDAVFLGDSHMFYGEWENRFKSYSILNRGIGDDIASDISELETIMNMRAAIHKNTLRL